LLLSLRAPLRPPVPPPFPTRRSSDLLLFAILLGGAVVGWFVPALAFPAMLIAVVLGLVNAFKREPSKALIIGYADQRDEHRGKGDRKSTRLNSSHVSTSYAVFCLKKK